MDANNDEMMEYLEVPIWTFWQEHKPVDKLLTMVQLLQQDIISEMWKALDNL